MSNPASPLIQSQSRQSFSEPSISTGSLTTTKYSLLTTELPPSKYDSRLDQIKTVAWDAVTKNEDDGWQFHTEQDGIKIYLKKVLAADGKTTLNYCKGYGCIPADVETIRCVVSCSELRHEWDQMFGEGKLIELVDPNTVIAYASFKLPWPASWRDFVTIGRNIVLPNKSDGSPGGVFIWFGSIEHSDAPLVKKNVRGDAIFSTWLLTPNIEDPTKTDVVYSVAQDPKGSIPKALVDAANLLQPRTIGVIRDVIANKPTVVQQALEMEAKKFRDAITVLEKPASPTAQDGPTSSDTVTDGGSGAAAGGSEFILAEEGDFNQDDYSFGVVLPQTELPPELKALLDDAFNKGWSSCHEDDGWEYHKEIEGIKIWLKPSGTGQVKLSKGIGIINAPPSHTHSMFTNDTTRKEWDSMYNSGNVIEQFDSNTYMGHGAFDAPWPISGRDFTTITRTALLKDGSIFHWSTNHTTPKCPPSTKFVRGKLLYSGLLISPIENGTKSRITYAIGSDPSGSLPAAVAEAAALSQPLCIAAIAKVVSTRPAVVTQAIAATRAKYEKITGSGSGFNINRETLPSIGSIEWPEYNEVKSSDDEPGVGLKWLEPLHEFSQQSTLSTITSSLSYARSNGGIFRTFSPDVMNTALIQNTDKSPSPPQFQNLPFGVLALKITHLRGKYLSVLGNMSLYFTITFEYNQLRTANAPYFDGVNPRLKKDPDAPRQIIDKTLTNHFCQPITRPDSTVLIELWGEQRLTDQRIGVSRACLGTLRLSLGELFEGDVISSQNHSNNSIGLGNPTKARRCWFPLTNIPIEIDRTCTHYDLLQHKTKTGKSKLSALGDGADDGANFDGVQYLDDPRGLYICFESCIVLSKFKLFMNDVLSLEHSYQRYSNPHSTLAAMNLLLPPALAKHPKNLLELAPTPKDPELCRQVGQMGIALTGGGLFVASDIEPDDLAAATSTFSAHLFIRNVIRCLSSLSPILTIVNVLYDLITWKSTVHTLFAMFLWVLLCLHPYLIIPIITVVILYSILSSSANYHFLQAASRSNTTYAQMVKNRYALAQNYVDQLIILIPTLSPKSQAIGVLIQVITGRLATLLENVWSLFSWDRMNDNALMVSIFSTILFFTSIYPVITSYLPAMLRGESLMQFANGGNSIGTDNIVKLYSQISNSTIATATATATTTAAITTSDPQNQLPWFISFFLDKIASPQTQSTTALVPVLSIAVAVVLILSWNSPILRAVKLLVGAIFRSCFITQHIRRESRTVRLFSGEPKQ